jgi:hypothetical protein
LKKLILISLIFILSFSRLFASGPDGLFIENKGQWPDEVHYFAKFNSYNLWITGDGLVFDIHRISQKAGEVVHKAHAFEYSFTEANEFEVIAENSISKVNYFIGNDKSKWVRGANAFRGLTVKDLYTGIDLILYNFAGELRYDFIVAPGTDPKQIKLKIEGADYSLKGDNLVISTSLAEIINSDLHTFSINQSDENKVKSKFIEKDGCFSIKVGDYDRSKPLRIDPLVTSRIFGGNDYDYGEALAVDLNSNTYIAGYTYSFDFPTTLDSYDPSFKTANPPKPDCFISKFSASDFEVVYSTFLGSFTDDYLKGIRVDNQGRVFVTGYTGQSESFPVTEGAYQEDNNGGFDCFVTCLNTSGDQLIFSTLIGGTKDDYANAIAIDNNGNSYITGFTVNSGNFPVTDGSVSTTENGKNEVFVTKLNNDGTGLVFSSYLGGSENDFGQAINVDILQNVYVAGITRSVDFPVTGDAFDNSYNDPDSNEEYSDCFITKIDPNGQSFIYSSYFGGNSKDAAYGLDVDPKYNVYLTGYSESSDFPTTQGCYDPTYNSNDELGRGDAFIAKFRSDFSLLEFSTYIGGESTERAFSIKADNTSNSHITGSTNSSDFPTTSNGFDRQFSDTTNNSDAFYLKLDSAGRKLQYGTYLGGRESDIAKKIEVLPLGSAVIVGTTFSKDFPDTKNGEETLLSNAFVSVLYPFTDLSIDAGEDRAICKGDSVIIGNAANGGVGELSFTWIPAGGLSDPSIAQPWAKPEVTTEYKVVVRDELGNMAEDFIKITVINIKDIEISGSAAIEENTIAVYTITPIDGASYTWSVRNGEILTGQGTNQATIKWTERGNGYVDLYIDTFDGCEDYVQRLQVIVGEDKNVRIIPITPLEFCANSWSILDVGPGYQAYHWSNDVITRYDTVRFAGKIWCVVIDAAGISRTSDTVTTSIKSSPKPPFIRYYEGFLQCLELAPSYQWYRNDVAISGATGIKYWPTMNGIYKVEIGWTYNECKVFSDTIQLLHLSVEDLDKQGMTIIPNPNEGDFDLEINSMGGQKVELIVQDLLGKSYYSEEIIINSDSYLKKLNLSHLPNGMYFIEIRNESKKILKKLVIY